MPPKRKAADLKDTPPSTRLRTRSSGPLKETQSAPPPTKRRRGRPPGIRVSALTPSSSKENDKSKSRTRTRRDVSSGDEMDLLGVEPSPSKAAKKRGEHSDDDMDLLGSSPRATPQPSPSSSKGTPRRRGKIMEVIITTPRSSTRTPRNIGDASADSPSPSKRPRIAKDATPPPPRAKRTRNDHKPRSPSPQASDDDSNAPPPPAPLTSPSKQALAAKPLPRVFPSHLQPYLQSQKTAVLHALQHPPLFEDDPSVFNQLKELLNGTVHRNEGNSCLVLGPRGSGKSRLVDRVLSSLPSTSTASPVVVRLSAHCQTNDRMALREIARQVQQQIGSSSALPALPADDPDDGSADVDLGRADVDLPPPAHLPALISALPALGRAVVVVLDAFDGFAGHARQALLYCLLDTVQSCRGGAPVDAEVVQGGDALPDNDGGSKAVKGDHGLLVVGMTSRVDCLTLLEKRVKSRFSHRVMRVRALRRLGDFVGFARAVLCVDAGLAGDAAEEWRMLWAVSVEKFLADKDVYNVFKETFAFVKDVRMLCRLLISSVTALAPTAPWLTAPQLLASAATQRPPQRFPFLPQLPYPHIALLVAAAHAQTRGHDTFTLAMLHDAFAAQARAAAAAPVGGGVGMVRVARGVLVGAFEQLVATRVFRAAAAPAAHVAREFVRYRCVAERGEVRAAVESLGHTTLKKWFYKAQ